MTITIAPSSGEETKQHRRFRSWGYRNRGELPARVGKFVDVSVDGGVEVVVDGNVELNVYLNLVTTFDGQSILVSMATLWGSCGSREIGDFVGAR